MDTCRVKLCRLVERDLPGSDLGRGFVSMSLEDPALAIVVSEFNKRILDGHLLLKKGNMVVGLPNVISTTFIPEQKVREPVDFLEILFDIIPNPCFP